MRTSSILVALACLACAVESQVPAKASAQGTAQATAQPSVHWSVTCKTDIDILCKEGLASAGCSDKESSSCKSIMFNCIDRPDQGMFNSCLTCSFFSFDRSFPLLFLSCVIHCLLMFLSRCLAVSHCYQCTHSRYHGLQRSRWRQKRGRSCSKSSARKRCRWCCWCCW